MEIIFASNNKGKIFEMKQKLKKYNIDVKSLKEVGIQIEIAETGNSFEENAKIKAEKIFELKKIPVIADDSGLEVEALNGKPRSIFT